MGRSLAQAGIVVVGGGAGGLELTRGLARRYGRNHRVTLIERNRTHIWKPLLHEVAAGSLDANLDEVSYRNHCHRWGYRYVCGEMEGIDRQRREVLIAPLLDEDGTELVGQHSVPYDWLVIAIGSQTNDFATEGAREHCVFLDDRVAADRFRSRLLVHCLRVSRALSRDGIGAHFVRVAIVGGGATGVELAAELYSSAAALRDYGLDTFDESRLKVTLLEAGPRILPALPERLATAARQELEKLGVEVLEGTPVSAVTATAMITPNRRVPADLRVWAAGVRGAPVLAKLDGLEVTPSTQLVVRPSLQTTKDDRIFAIGDCCSCVVPGTSRPVPPRAQAAHQMAAHVVAVLGRAMRDEAPKNFVYRDRGSLVSLSRHSTVGSLMGNLVGGAMAVEGRLARLAYTSLYRLHLLAIHGWLRGAVMILVGQINMIIRPRMKMH